jgi:hypothetical protein
MNNENEYEYEKYLNPEIIEDNTTTYDLSHELVIYLDELFERIPNEKDKAMIMQNIGSYYDSLNTLLIKHIMEQPYNSIP